MDSRPIALAVIMLLCGQATPVLAGCIPFREAPKHVGETKCVSGKVLRVKPGSRGVHFFDFCEDYRVCPFTVVVFASNLKHVGDVRQLEGKDIEIHGTIKEYDGRAEIILERAGQLSGEAAKIPALPKGYDVEQKGRYSAGQFSYPHSSPKKRQKKQQPPIVTEEPEPE
ncbi:MAG TPA: hypothetical protein VFA89_01870 [Terriglobales bacterium]|nr:hypothetical protein [Terriglobales bacterium]